MTEATAKSAHIVCRGALSHRAILRLRSDGMPTREYRSARAHKHTEKKGNRQVLFYFFIYSPDQTQRGAPVRRLYFRRFHDRKLRDNFFVCMPSKDIAQMPKIAFFFILFCFSETCQEVLLIILASLLTLLKKKKNGQRLIKKGRLINRKSTRIPRKSSIYSLQPRFTAFQIASIQNFI